ncbi:MAG: heat-inducible transcription repressor HrcA [Dehalococcoidia bacterium]|nr:MAG: heat-inducible transcription repressor HrcA [Dehalococcoidia bacterium]
MLTQRRSNILKIVVGEYISTGLPVSSHTVTRRGVGVSPATIRNEMVELEEEGYLCQPHISAGRIPSDKAYRHYIESMVGDVQLSLAEQRLIREQFHQVESEVEEWTRLAAAILSRTVRNVAIVTLPKPCKSRLKHLDLVSLQEFLALLVLVLREAKLKQQVLTLEEAVSQEELSVSARRLSSACAGLTCSEISSKGLGLSPLEGQVVGAVVQIMQAEEGEDYEEPCVDGLHHMLSQPEFASRSKLTAIVELLEQRSLLKSLLPQVLTGEGVRVVIGRENKPDAMRDCSMVITRYGIPGEIGGALGVMGPTRMPYNRAIPTVCFLSSVMSEMVGELYG